MNRIRSWLNRRSIVLTWILSYLAVLFLPVLISLGVYWESSRMLEDEIHEANFALLNQTREVMDKQFQTMERLNFELTWNVKLRELLDNNKYANYPEDFKYDLHRITQDLITYKSAYTQVDAFYVYMAAKDIVLLPNVYRDAEFAYRLLHDDDSMPYEQWKAMMKQDTGSGFHVMTRRDEAGKPVKTIAYTSTPLGVTGGKIGTNVIMIDQSRILQTVQNVELFNQGHVLLLNDQNEVLVSNRPIAIPEDFHYERLDSRRTLTMNVEHQAYEVTSLSSGETGLKYVSFIPSRLYWEKAQQVRKLTYISIGISLISGAMLTYFYVKRNYDPVRRLVRIFTNKPRYGGSQGVNEFHFLQNAVSSTLAEMDSMMLNMNRQHHIVRSHFVTRLLKGKLDDEIPIDEELAAFQIAFESDRFAVMLLYVEEIDLFLNRNPNAPLMEKIKLLHFIITNVVEELVNRKHRGYVAEVGETMACLVSYATADGEEHQDLIQTALEAKRFLYDHYKIRLAVSISNAHDGVSAIPDAYSEALYAMEYKLVMGGEDVVSCRDILHEPAESDRSEFYPSESSIRKMVNYTKVGDYDNAKLVLDEIIKQNFESPVASLAVIKCLMMDLVGTMIRAIGEAGDLTGSFLQHNPEIIDSLIASETIKDMHVRMTELLSAICEYTGEQRRQRQQQSSKRAMDDRIRDVMAYVNDHLSDPNLNISTIGHHFGLKPAYLSRLFKDHTGEGVLDSINKARLAQAKSMMADPRRTINEIAPIVGYHDVNAFIRIFKKYEGVTPGKYRETLDM